ncbi:hypothetical protein TSUD_259250 [Trifolium subterraneum]|uniref:RING-CH-type domain-containing protein n=1 Tax=Trifolium subterraneum TaxID=3900 RepID=A0A2Z6NG34_TRISU|nr:hypothetical protein TSUD_259250 [Trifolium subterraneum]
MQLVSNTDKDDDEECSECQPILNHQDSSSFSCEIIPANTDDDIENVRVDDSSHLLNEDHPQCRICLDLGGEDLIAPCHCKECRAVFILRANVPKDRWWLRLKFQFLVARDHAFIFIIVQLVVAFLGVLIYKFYGDELREMFGYEEHPYGFYTMAVLAIILVGLLYGFFIAIICGQRINERHYHVLAKQELTKEYVVEDREHVKNVPELDPSHVTELRMLGLY